jgi:CpXC protein
MGLTKPYQVKTPDGKMVFLNLADCVNVKRTPKVRAQVLTGEFNRIPDPSGKGSITIEKPFFYCDFDRHQFFLVKPRQERHLYVDASAQLVRMVKHVPEGVSGKADQVLRVVFGLGELREKLLADEAGYDDRMIEFMKVFLIYEHPFLLKNARLRITLDRVTEESVDFFAGYDHNPRKFTVGIPRKTADDIMARKEEMKTWAKSTKIKTSLFDLKNDHWVNFWRWSPSNETLSRLKTYAAEARDKKEINTTSADFKTMLKYLPRGSQLSNWAKKDLNDLFNWAKEKSMDKLQATLFEIRFDRELEDDWYVNDDPDDIDTLWKLLQALPPTNVEGNTALREIRLDEGEGGGSYDPNSHDIYIGEKELHNPESFEDVVRHEVGHAVHEKNDALITPWLAKQFGWQSFDTTDPGINAWVGMMGGYGKATEQERKEIREYLRIAVGIGKESGWTPPQMPPVPTGHHWRAKNFGPRLAAEKTGADWFENNKHWYRKGGKVFFLNYWYQQFMVVDEATLTLINTGMPDKYAAMSPMEFFAELYALYFDLDDPMRKNIPAPVMKWMKANIGAAIEKKPEVRPIARSNKMRPKR